MWPLLQLVINKWSYKNTKRMNIRNIYSCMNYRLLYGNTIVDYNWICVLESYLGLWNNTILLCRTCVIALACICFAKSMCVLLNFVSFLFISIFTTHSDRNIWLRYSVSVIHFFCQLGGSSQGYFIETFLAMETLVLILFNTNGPLPSHYPKFLYPCNGY